MKILRIVCLECGCPAPDNVNEIEPLWRCPNCGGGFVKTQEYDLEGDI